MPTDDQNTDEATAADSTTDAPKAEQVGADAAAPQAEAVEAEAPESEGGGDAPDADDDGGARVQLKDFGEELKTAVQAKLDSLGMKVGADGKLDTSGMSRESIKAGADVVTGLMGQVVGALQQAAKNAGMDSGSSASSGAATQRASSGAGGERSGDAKVIDLAAEREKRGPRSPSPLEQRLTHTLKSAFVGFMRDNAEISAGEDGQEAASVDNDFLKNNAGKLMGTMLQAFAGAILPPQIEFGGKAKPAADADGDGTTDGAEDTNPDGSGSSSGDDLKVKMNLDLAGLFSQLLPSSRPAAPAAESAADGGGEDSTGPDATDDAGTPADSDS